jgi:hypothetical protein
MEALMTVLPSMLRLRVRLHEIFRAAPTDISQTAIDAKGAIAAARQANQH